MIEIILSIVGSTGLGYTLYKAWDRYTENSKKDIYKQVLSKSVAKNRGESLLNYETETELEIKGKRSHGYFTNFI